MDNVLIDQRWYKSYCNKCPYLVNDEIMEKLHCVRPVGEGCLAEGILVAGVIMTDIHNARIQKACEDNHRPTRIKISDPVVSELTKKRQAKIHKRRR